MEKDNNKERVTGFMKEDNNMNGPKNGLEQKVMDDTMESLLNLVDASMKLCAKFALMPENELTADEKAFTQATAKAGLALMMGALLFKPEGGK